MKIAVLNGDGKEIATRDVLAAWEHRTMQPALLQQAVVTAAANARLPWAHTKGRGDVRGGGRKPWRQKGTGRARHGSIRSPIWKGGGATFGPSKERTYTKRFPAAMRRTALAMALTAKARDGEFVLLEDLPEMKKTAEAAQLVRALQRTGTLLFVVPQERAPALARVIRNLPGVAVIASGQLTAAEVLRPKHVVATTAAWDILDARLAQNRMQKQNKLSRSPAFPLSR